MQRWLREAKPSGSCRSDNVFLSEVGPSLGRGPWPASAFLWPLGRRSMASWSPQVHLLSAPLILHTFGWFFPCDCFTIAVRHLGYESLRAVSLCLLCLGSAEFLGSVSWYFPFASVSRSHQDCSDLLCAAVPLLLLGHRLHVGWPVRNEPKPCQMLGFLCW